MPTVNRTRPTTTKTTTPRASPTTSNGRGILAEAVPIAEIGDDSIHMLLYGRNRIGKTTLACQFPKPLVLVAVEHTRTGGARSVRKVPGVQYLKLTESAKVEQLGKELLQDCSVKTVVIDTASSLEEIVLAEICGWEETANLIAVGYTRPGAKVTTDQYVERSERMRQVLRPFLDLPCHVVIVANEKDHNPPEGRKSSMVRGMQAESFFAAAMGAGTTRWCQDGCDYVCQLYMDKEVRRVKTKVLDKIVEQEEETGRLVRRLRCQYHPNFAAGFRSENPESVPEFIEEPTYAKIAAVIAGKV